MKRRDFLKYSSLSAIACSVNGVAIKATAQDVANKKTRGLYSNGKKLILVRLNGGNDGLNTVIPLDKYAELTAARANVLIPSNQTLALNGTTDTALHPAMTGLQNLYNTGKLNIIQGVSYPNPDYSHFRASDIISSASDSNLYINSGWIGRLIDNQFPGAPYTYPTTAVADPFSIEIGYTSSQVIYGGNGLNGMTVSNLDYLYNIQNGTVDPAPATKGGNELTYVRFVIQQTEAYTIRLQAATAAGTNSVTYPTTDLANQLKIVAKLISGGLDTPVYIVNIGGFDTHDTQVNGGNTTTGEHANLLLQLSEAIAAFQLDIETQNLADDVVGLTFSEFGRRIKSNASNGTDHGAAAPMIVFGTAVNNAIIGTNPVLPANATVNDQVPMQYDFRQVYATIITDWFGISQANADTILNGNSYSWLPIFNSNVPLTLTMSGLIATEVNCTANLSWTTQNEDNLKSMEVMYSANATTWESVTTIDAKETPSNYTHVHHAPEGMAYYKLKIINKDGSTVLSNLAAVEINCKPANLQIYPNPATDFIHVEMENNTEPVSISLVNMQGNILQSIMSQNNKVTLHTKNIPSGIYNIVITKANANKQFYKVQIQQ